MDSAVLSAEAYGVKTTAPDMIHFLQENIKSTSLPEQLKRAIENTHTGYFKAGPMTQDLIWEQYPYPVTLNALLEGNSSKMAFDAVPVTEIESAREATRRCLDQQDWLNQRIRILCGVCSGEAIGHRHPGQQKLSQ